MRARGERFLLLDVREPSERERAHIAGAQLLPLARLDSELGALSDWKDATVVVHCHKGVRSARAARALAERGFTDVWSLAGGIEAWSLTVDPGVPRY
jgi:adenylyltransferase/sulfurtransferase